MESRSSIFLLMSSGVLLLLTVPEFILLKCQIFYKNKITIKIQLRGMSLRKDQKKRIQPIIAILKSCLQQSAREIINQQQIDRGIVEELLHTEVVNDIQNLSTLKLIIYQLILLISQQHLSRSSQGDDGALPINRISNLLASIKDILTDFGGENEGGPLKTIQKRNGKEMATSQRTHRNKQRIFSSYYNQYCTLVQEIQSSCALQNSQVNNSRVTCDDALIDQLQSIIFKKQSIIEALEKQLDEYNQRVAQLQKHLGSFKMEIKQLFEEKLLVEQQRDQLREEILQIVRVEPESTKSQESLQIQTGKCFWDNDCEQTISANFKPIQITDNDLMKCLLSQALTIEALIQ